MLVLWALAIIATAASLPSDCVDPRVVLVIRPQHDLSGRLLVQRVLVAHPELEIVERKPAEAHEVQFYKAIYGAKLFAQYEDRRPAFSEAVIARCFAVETCERLALFVVEFAPREQPKLFCGEPPATQGSSLAKVPELAPAKVEALRAGQ